MPNDVLTLALNGDISLNDFAITVTNFQHLVDSLTADVAGGEGIEWVIEDLQAGSAIMTLRGSAGNETAVERVVRAYHVVGQALERHEPIPYAPAIVRWATALTSIIDGKISSIHLETPLGLSMVTTHVGEMEGWPTMTFAYGSIKGRVETLTRRKRLRFTLYDSIFDRGITCHLRSDQEETMRNAWGRRVEVRGEIARDPVHGYPITIKNISDIQILADVQPGSYKRARGVAPVHADTEPPEVTIRRMRDAS
jgi:hypothetical protein